MAERLKVTLGITAAPWSPSFVWDYSVDVKEILLRRPKLLDEINSTRGLLASFNEIIDDEKVSGLT